MNLDTNKLSSAVRLALTLGAVATAGVAGSAMAQDTATTPPSGTKAKELQTIVVTGSRIRRVDIETSNPVISISRQAIQSTGSMTLGSVIQAIPANTGSFANPQTNNGGGTGASGVNLRGLGSNRTLVLINGNRVIPSGALAPTVDLNSIPKDMIERVEVLSDGASAIYGSDAIGGVVNIITRKNYQGAEFSTDYGISDHSDGARQGYSFTFGQTGDKGSIMGGIEYNKQDAISAANRSFSKNSVSLTGSTNTPPYAYVGGSSFNPAENIQLPTNLQSTFGCSAVSLNPGGNPQVASTANYHCFGNSDKYNYAPVNLIMTPQERTYAWLSGDYHLSDNVDAYLQFFHTKTSSAFQLAPALVGADSIGGNATISSQSYYNPFGVDYAPGGYDFRARLTSAGPRAAQFGSTIDQLYTGLKGSMEFLGHGWDWDAGVGYGHFSLVTLTEGLPNISTLSQAMGPSFLDTTTNTVVCGTPTGGGPNGDLPVIISGCTPVNGFDLNNPAYQSVIKSIAANAISNSYSMERTAHVDANGTLFELPGGSVRLALGASYRNEYVRNNVDPVLLLNPATGSCTLGSQCSANLQGGYNVKEAYGELFVPIVKDMPFAKSLNVTLGDRYSKYSTFGNTNNTKLAVEWRPINDLLLRGTVTTVFRAPNVNNVYGAPVSSAPSLSSDPCDGYTGNPVNPACVNVPTNGTFVNKDVALHQQISALSSGSQYAHFPLGPEKGKSFDYGFVYDPSWLPGFSTSVDFWRVYLNNTITQIGAQTILDLCSGGLTQFCPLINRYASGPNQGQIQQIVQPFVNLGRTDASGIDFGFRYRLPQFDVAGVDPGHFGIRFNSTYLTRFDVQTAPGSAANTTYHFAGHFINFGSAAVGACPNTVGGVCMFPRWRAQAELDWNLGPWDASWRMRYIGKFRLGNANLSEGTSAVGSLPGYVIPFGSTTYSDISLGYEIQPINAKIQVGINNVFNKQPPFLYANNTLNANTDPADFDLIGRYYWGRVTVKF